MKEINTNTENNETNQQQLAEEVIETENLRPLHILLFYISLFIVLTIAYLFFNKQHYVIYMKKFIDEATEIDENVHIASMISIDHKDASIALNLKEDYKDSIQGKTFILDYEDNNKKRFSFEYNYTAKKDETLVRSNNYSKFISFPNEKALTKEKSNDLAKTLLNSFKKEKIRKINNNEIVIEGILKDFSHLALIDKIESSIEKESYQDWYKKVADINKIVTDKNPASLSLLDLKNLILAEYYFDETQDIAFNIYIKNKKVNYYEIMIPLVNKNKEMLYFSFNQEIDYENIGNQIIENDDFNTVTFKTLNKNNYLELLNPKQEDTLRINGSNSPAIKKEIEQKINEEFKPSIEDLENKILGE